MGSRNLPDVRFWIDKGNKSSNRVHELLPILVRQSRLEEPITYGDAAREMGVHHRAIRHIAGYIGHTLEAIGNKRGWKRHPPPPIHALIVNDVTRLPGTGINGFLSHTYQQAKSSTDRKAVLKAIYASAATYEHWNELFDLLEIEFDEDDLAGAVQKAKRSKGRGGEGPHRLALKNYVMENPQIVGLAEGSKVGEPEWPTASGDRVDVVFVRKGLLLAVEVKPYHASEGDLLRGVFQCLKYRAVLRAECAMEGDLRTVKTLLVLGGKPTLDVIKAANRLGVEVLENVMPEMATSTS